MNFRKYFFTILSILIIFGAKAQENNIALGQWRVHLAYTLNTSIEEFNGKIYVSSQVNGFTVDLNDHSIDILSKTNGLSDVSITKIRANREKNILVLGYSNGNIDILKNNTIINISDIKRKDIVGSKRINDIIFWKNYAYICCDFGVCVVDIDKYEIKETYDNLGPAGSGNKITGCTFSGSGDSIFLATERGLMVAKNHSSVNLMDFSNWYTYGPSSNLTTQMKGVIWFNSKLYTVTKDNILFYKSGNTFTQSAIDGAGFRSFKVINNNLIIAKGPSIAICKNETDTQIAYPISANNITDALIDSKGNIWSMDYWIGLATNNSGSSNYYLIKPNGPSLNTVYNLSYYNNSILVTRGGYTSSHNYLFNSPEYNIFDNTQWKTYNRDNNPIPECRDIINGAYNPVNNNTYFASFGYGLLVANKDNTYTLFDDTNGPFPKMRDDEGAIFVTYTEVDKYGKVWVCNATPNSTAPILHSLNTDGTWFSKSFGNYYPLEILIDEADNKWLRMRSDKGGGIIVYNDKTNTHRYLSDIKGNGSLPNNNVRAMAKDLNGDVWLATDKGICVFYNPRSITTSGEATQPIFDGFPLLYNESISCIEVDGGNRKWVGTKNGVWLLNDDGTEVIQYFTSSNSPLLSDYIFDIEVNDLTGEVFIGTDKGLISFRGDATAGKTNPEEIKVFPNPVKVGYNGTISISGLSKDAEVKITDIYGTLIYQTIAEGGTAAWKGRNYKGEFAAPGVYLIFSASSDGTSGLVGKIAIE